MRACNSRGEVLWSFAVRKIAATAAIVLGMGAAAHAHQPCPNGLAPVVEYQMFFGLEKEGGRTVSESDWQRFLAEVITPRFRAGLTVFDGRGQWLRPDGVTEREAVKVVIAASRAGAGMTLVDEVSAIWLEQTGQDAVFRTAAPSCAGLHDAAR